MRSVISVLLVLALAGSGAAAQLNCCDGVMSGMKVVSCPSAAAITALSCRHVTVNGVLDYAGEPERSFASTSHVSSYADVPPDNLWTLRSQTRATAERIPVGVIPDGLFLRNRVLLI